MFRVRRKEGPKTYSRILRKSGLNFEILDLHHVDELKNFAANNLLSWCLKLRTGIRVTG